MRELLLGDLRAPLGTAGLRPRARQIVEHGGIIRRAVDVAGAVDDNHRVITRATWGAAVAAIVAAASPARADGVGVIVRGPERARVAAAMTAAIGESARPVPDAVAAARAQLAAGAVPIEMLAAFRHARELVDDGWRTYLRVAFDDAARQLQAARAAIVPLVALPGGAELYADASLRLGIVLAHLSRDDDSRAAIALALALDPDRPITLAEFSPDALALVDTARAASASIATRHVLVAAEPAGALVAVDGRELGAAPVEADLAIGAHVVVARAPLHAGGAIAATVDATTTSLRVELAPDPDAEAIADGADAATTDDATRRLVEATLRYGDVDAVVLVAEAERRGAPALLVERCTTAGCTGEVEVGYGDASGVVAAARAAWADVRDADAHRAAVALDLRGTTAPEHHRCEACRNPYVLGGVGAALVLGAIAIAVVATESRPPPTVGVNPGDFGRP